MMSAQPISITVATDELDQLARSLFEAVEQCQEIVARIPPLRTGVNAANDADLWEVQGSVHRSIEHLDGLARSVRSAAELYRAAERTSARAIEVLASQLAAAAGLVLSRLGILLLPALVTAAGRLALVWGLIPPAHRDGVVDALGSAVGHLLPALSEPALIELVRVALSLADDAALGTVGVPPGLVGLVGEGGLGLSGIDSAAVVVAALAMLGGGSGVDPVLVQRVGSDLRRGGQPHPADPPTSLADRVARVPDAATPIVIERFTLPDGAPHVEVYIAGTDAHAPMGGEQPWDMASNVAIIAEQNASSLQAVRAALAAEGIDGETSIVFTGYSQGGAIATVLAESGDYRTTGLVTVGAPSGAMPVRGDYPAIVIEHRDDLVPVLSGIRRETTAVVVRGEGLEPGASVEGALPAHDLDRYRRTAAQADAHTNVALRAAIEALPSASATGVRSAYTAIRIPRSIDG